MKKLLFLIMAGFSLTLTAAGETGSLLTNDSGMPGDVNNDGKVDIADVACIISYILGSTPNQFDLAAANVNGDDEINYSDISRVLDMMLDDSSILKSYYQIPPEQLNGWDEGMFYMDMLNENNSFYIVSHSDYENNMRIVYLNNFKNEDITQSMAFVFAPNDEIHDIFMAGYQFEAYPKEEDVTFIAYDKEGRIIDVFDVPYEDNPDIASARAKSPTRAIEHYRIVYLRHFLGKAGKVLWNVADIGNKFDDGKYADILKDLLIGRLTGMVTKSFMWELALAHEIDSYLKQLYENNKNWFMGSAEIEITSIKRVNNSTISVEGVINNVSAIPPTRLVASEYPNYIDGKLVYLKEVPNYVLYGVAEGKSGQPGLYLHDKCTTPITISGNNFSCTLPVEYKPGQTLYFRPFLVPEVTMQSICTNIRYGKRKEFIDVDVELSNFEQTKCYKNGDKYMAQFTIDGSIPELFQELSEWGFDVRTKSGSYWQRFNAKENNNDYYPPIKKSFTCDITIEEEDITDYGIERIAEIIVTPYVSYWNSQNPLMYLDEKVYTITIKEYETTCPDDNHPHWIDLGLPSGTIWRCCNEGASTPEAYGGYYKFRQVSSAPYFDQIKELLNYCTSVWTTLNGINGRKFIGPNGGTIFLPAAGYSWSGKLLIVGTDGYYWSRTPNTETSARGLYFKSDYAGWGGGGNSCGFSVRPVR